jgi:hypothetical protein
MSNFWKEMECGVRCVRLVEQFLKEEENLLQHLTEMGCSTSHAEFTIARMKYALGEVSIRPNWRDYFPTNDADSHIKE